MIEIFNRPCMTARAVFLSIDNPHQNFQAKFVQNAQELFSQNPLTNAVGYAIINTESEGTTMKVGDIYFVDLSPVVGNEVPGIRPCKIVKVYCGDLVRVQPRVMNKITMEYEFLEMHERTVSTKRLKEKISN